MDALTHGAARMPEIIDVLGEAMYAISRDFGPRFSAFGRNQTTAQHRPAQMAGIKPKSSVCTLPNCCEQSTRADAWPEYKHQAWPPDAVITLISLFCQILKYAQDSDHLRQR